MADSFSMFDLDSLLDEFDEDLVRQAIKIANRGGVTRLEYDEQGGILSGFVINRGIQYHASVKLEKTQLLVGCDCDYEERGDDICEHVVALIAAWTKGLPGLEDSPAWGPAGQGQAAAPQDARQPFWPPASPEAIRADWSERLENLTVKEVRELGERFRVKLKGIKRDEVLNGMLEVLCSPAWLAEALERLQPDTRRLQDLLCALWDARPFNPNPLSPFLQKALDNGLKARPLKDCLAELAGYRLWEYAPGMFRLPLGVLALRLPDPALFQSFAGEPAGIRAARPYQLARLALRLVLLAQAGRLSLERAPAAGWPGETPQNRRMAEIPLAPEAPGLAREALDALQTPDTPRAEIQLAARLAEVLGLWERPRSETTREAGGPQLKAWLRLSTQEQSRRLFEAALALPSSLEMDLAAQSGGFTLARASGADLLYTTYLSQLAAARLRLGRLLAHVPAGQWLDLESILHTIHGLQPDWQLDLTSRSSRGNYSPETIFAVVDRRRIDLQGYPSWRRSFGLFHQAILVQTFHWLGLVDVGYAAADETQPVAVRLTRFGEYLLGRQPNFQPAPSPEAAARPLAIHPEGTLELDLDTAPIELVQLLLQIAEPEEEPGPARSSGGKSAADSPKAGQLPRTLRYRLSDAGLGQAFDAGWTLDQITDSLTAASGAGLPAGLLQRLRPLWERYGRVQLYENLALIQFGDDYCLPELLANTRLSQILVYTFSPRLIAIRPETTADFLAELLAKGYTPHLEGPIHDR